MATLLFSAVSAGLEIGKATQSTYVHARLLASSQTQEQLPQCASLWLWFVPVQG